MSNTELARLLLAAMFEAAQLVVFLMRGNIERARKSEQRFKDWMEWIEKRESEGKEDE